MSDKAVGLRKATAKMMEDCYDRLEKHVDETSFPDWIVDKFRALGTNGLTIKDFGSPALSILESGSIIYELAKRDGSVATFFLVHNSIGMAVVDVLGDEEQRKRILTPAVNFDRILSFGLTEPDNGSDASNLRTTATKVEGGYKLNGVKRWIGNATMGDCIVWARNPSDGNRVQAFVVEKGTPGYSPKKIEGKWSLRMTQNAEITLTDCFVPDKNKLTKAKDFATGTNAILESSRLMVAWMACGLASGAYENALKYTLRRVQFGKPVA